jgi:hypothetical protein
MFGPVAGGSVNRPTFRQWIIDLNVRKAARNSVVDLARLLELPGLFLFTS